MLLSMKPGLTRHCKVYVRNGAAYVDCMRQQMEEDAYVQRSFWNYLILLVTVKTVVGQSGV